MSLHTDLLAVAALLRRGKCEGAFARSAEGIYVPSTSPNACSWCIIGAIRAVMADGRRRSDALDAIKEEIAVPDTEDIAGYSDSHSQAEVVAIVERAAAKAKGGA